MTTAPALEQPVTTRAERVAAADAAFMALIAEHRWLDFKGCSQGCRHWPCDALSDAAAACDAALTEPLR